MTSGKDRHEFSSAEVTQLLAELDWRLESGGVAASVFVVGGAAVAATGVRQQRLTQDVDVITDEQAVLREAALIARERGIPENWLNPNARMWMPPLPDGVLDRPPQPGLRITYADDGFLFATKLIAQRAKDADDIVALARRLGMQGANASEVEAHIRRYYTDDEALQFIIDGTTWRLRSTSWRRTRLACSALLVTATRERPYPRLCPDPWIWGLVTADLGPE